MQNVWNSILPIVWLNHISTHWKILLQYGSTQSKRKTQWYTIEIISTSPRFHPHANSIAKHIQTKCVYWYFTLLTDVLIYIFKISILYLIVLINRLLKGTFLLVFSFYLNSLKNLLGKGFWKNQIFAKRNPPLFQGDGA